MDRLGELQVLTAIAEAGSLAGGARRLGRSPPAVTRILAELEARLGVTLIERTTRRCRPTEAGRRLVEQARHLSALYDEAVGEAAGEAVDPRGEVRMTAPLAFGRDHVAPAVSAFLDAWPAVSVDLDLSDRVADLNEDGFDLGLRIGPVADPSLVRRRLGEVRRLAVASPAYLERRGVPQAPGDLAAHDIVQHTALGTATPWRLRAPDGAVMVIELRGRLAVNQADAAIAAARAGRGVVSALSYQVDADLRAGRLVRVLQAFEPEAAPVSLVWPEARRLVRRTRLLIDHLAGTLSRLPVLRP